MTWHLGEVTCRLTLLLCLGLVLGCGDDDGGDTGDTGDARDTGDTGTADADADALDADAAVPPPLWSTDFPLGTFGSPRLLDGELLLGFGREGSFGGAISIDPRDGTELALFATGQELFTVPMVITRPDAPDLHVVGGRNGWLLAIDAATRDEAWRYRPNGRDAREVGIYNFYTGLVVDDQNDDGVDDLLLPNGGDNERGPGADRPPGWLLLLSGATGEELARVGIPDERETYMSLVRWTRPDGDYVLFGSGGETLPGGLHVVREEELLGGSLVGAEELIVSERNRGLVAPPSLADLDGDGALDLIAAPFDARLVVISGATQETVWTHPQSDEETNNTPAIGDLDGDGDLDIAHITHSGVFPAWTGSTIRVFDATSGVMTFERSVAPLLILTSPIAIDHNDDGKDELLFVTSDPSYFRGGPGGLSLISLDVAADSQDVLHQEAGLSASTGWAGDADGDGLAEWFVPTNHAEGGRLLRVALGSAPSRVSWGGYLGTDHDAVFRR